MVLILTLVVLGWRRRGGAERRGDTLQPSKRAAGARGVWGQISSWKPYKQRQDRGVGGGTSREGGRRRCGWNHTGLGSVVRAYISPRRCRGRGVQQRVRGPGLGRLHRLPVVPSEKDEYNCFEVRKLGKCSSGRGRGALVAGFG